MGIIIGVFLSTFHPDFDPILKNKKQLDRYITVQSQQSNIQEGVTFQPAEQIDLEPCHEGVLDLAKFKKFKDLP